MSVDHCIIKQPKIQSAFQKATAGDIVIVWDEPERMDDNPGAWCMVHGAWCMVHGGWVK